jgi:hypothetical protein
VSADGPPEAEINAYFWLGKASAALDSGVQTPAEVMAQALTGIGFALVAIAESGTSREPDRT